MSKAHDGGASGNGRARLFSASDRKRILALVVGKASGVEIEVGGVTFDLVAVSANELMSVLDLVIKFSDLFEKLGTGKAIEQDSIKQGIIFRAIGEDGGRIMQLVRSMLYRSAGLDAEDRSAEDRALFEDWFAKLPIVDTIRRLAPAVLQANGIGAIRPTTTTENATPTPTPSTPANTSSQGTPGPTPSESSTA